MQQGERDTLGRKRKPLGGPEGASDAKAKFEQTMDATKEVGSKAIGASQTVKASIDNNANKTSSRLREAYYKVFSVHF